MSQVQAVRKQQHHEITYLIEETRDLVSPPQVHFALLEVLNDPISTTDDMAEVIAMDPALTARLLRIVNSPYYGLVRRIDTISRAVTVIGSNELFNLAVAVAATAVFSRLPGSLVNMDCFWRHSVFAAMVSRELAKRANVLHPERLFVGGLLHDVGSLLLYNERPDTMSDLLLVAQGDEEVMFHAELHRLGFSHAEVGEGILSLWQLPETLCIAIGAHHTPLDTQGPCPEAGILYLADHLANRSERSGFAAESRPNGELDEAVLKLLGIGKKDLIPAVEAATVQFDQSIAMFLP
ncbi:MAG: HDOD domain-containing protein [Proteobacteria bacterium]|nr:MAG: HDOD domain-containing protein [Pseudomonadota bacterium]